jgi:hypothetical protein
MAVLLLDKLLWGAGVCRPRADALARRGCGEGGRLGRTWPIRSDRSVSLLFCSFYFFSFRPTK